MILDNILRLRYQSRTKEDPAMNLILEAGQWTKR